MKALSQVFGIAVLIGGAAACSQNADVGVTRSESLVANCQKVGDVSVGSGIADADVNAELSTQAKARGANYVLVASDGARSGSAYSCPAPAAASH